MPDVITLDHYMEEGRQAVNAKFTTVDAAIIALQAAVAAGSGGGGGGGGGAVSSVNSMTGAVVLNYTHVGAASVNDPRFAQIGLIAAHAVTHKHSGGDEVAVATSAANAIPKALGSGKLARSWLDTVAHYDTSYLWTEAQTIRKNNGQQLRLEYDAATYGLVGVLADGTLSLTATGNHLLQPDDDVILQPLSYVVTSGLNYRTDIGRLNQKWRAAHIAELIVDTLVAQDVMSTIGGRVLVGPTTTLTRDLMTTATTIYTKHNNLGYVAGMGGTPGVGDKVRLEARGQVEFMEIASAPTPISSTEYSYSVLRNLDGTGANTWLAGDAVANTGRLGGPQKGFLDLYSVAGVRYGAGPTIVANVRNSDTFNDWSPRAALGNLNGIYGYASDIFGFGAGKVEATHIVVDETNGVRIKNGAVVLGQWDTSANITLGQVTTGKANTLITSAGKIALRQYLTERIVLNADGTMSINDGTGAAVFSFDTTTGALFVKPLVFGTNGSLRANNWYLDANGLRAMVDSGGAWEKSAVRWLRDTDSAEMQKLESSYVAGLYSALTLTANMPGSSTAISSIILKNGTGAGKRIQHLIDGSIVADFQPSDIYLYGIVHTAGSLVVSGALTAYSGITNGAAWIAPTFQNSWANYGSGEQVAQYRKDVTGQVQLRGLIKSGASGTTAFTLPTGYQPNITRRLPIIINNGSVTTGYVYINNLGEVQLYFSGTLTWADLSAIEFQGEQ